MDMRQTLGKFTTPAGTLVFPLYLNTPDDKFDDSEDKIKYKATIRLSGDGAAEFLKATEAAFDGWLEMVKSGSGKKPKVQQKNIQWYTSETKRWDDIGESTSKLIDDIQEGEAIFKLTSKAYRRNRDGSYQAQRPAIFDAQGNLIAEEVLPMVGFGSTAKVSGQFYGWTTKAGVASMSLLLRAVQLIDVREPGQSETGAEDFGFSATEGFVSEAETFIENIGGEKQGGDF